LVSGHQEERRQARLAGSFKRSAPFPLLLFVFLAREVLTPAVRADVAVDQLALFGRFELQTDFTALNAVRCIPILGFRFAYARLTANRVFESKARRGDKTKRAQLEQGSSR